MSGWCAILNHVPPSATELKALYCDQGLSTRATAKALGVSKPTIQRWLRKYGLPVRPPGNGLANRGVAAPTADDLRRLIHQEHKTYREVAALYGVDLTAVPQWLDKLGIPRPSWRDSRFRGNPPEVSIDTVRERYEAGESAEQISLSLGYKSSTTILNLMREAGIAARKEGWHPQREFVSRAGCEVRSSYELRVANWLTDHNIAFEYEPDVPFGHGNTRADFFANGWYIEVWGVTQSKKYARRKKEKQAGYAAHNLPLIEVSYNHFSKRDGHILERRLCQCLKPFERPIYRGQDIISSRFQGRD